jgi:hypothetical protein
MKTKSSLRSASFETPPPLPGKDAVDSHNPGAVGRRSFLRKMGLAGASLAPVSALLMSEGKALAQEFGSGLTDGDVAILRFLAAAEILETDFWVQYTELAMNNPAFNAALKNLDSDMVQYVADNTDDEDSHQSFLNAFLASVGAQQVNLDRFRTLPSSQATGARQIGRLTNLTQLSLNTSWYTRYRSTENPDFFDQFNSPFPIVNRPGIPLNDIDTPPDTDMTPPITTRNAIRMQAIANTAAWHFPTVEQGGSSIYGYFIQQTITLVVLRILYAIGGSEIAHFQTWHDKAGNAVSDPLAPLTDPTPPQVTFPNLNAPPFGGEAFSTNLIMPEPCDFISEKLPDCAIIRPTIRRRITGPPMVLAFLTDMGLFIGQTPEFFMTLRRIAREANQAHRQLDPGEEEAE